MKECNVELRKSKGCDYSFGWRYCPFTGEKIIEHRKIKMSTLEELTDRYILNEDDLICIVRNGWFYDRFIGRRVILKNDAIEPFTNVEMMINNKSLGNCKFFELEAVDGVRKMAFGEDSNSYKDSNIRKWLNNEFYNGFYTDFQEIIQKKEICPDGDHLEDNITIPSVADICSDAKWFDDIDWISSEDKHDGSFTSVRKHIKRMGWYWTRTRNSNNTSNVWSVYFDGDVTTTASYSSAGGCVVPAFRIGQSKQ